MTADQVMQSPTFLEAAGREAIEFLAEKHGATTEAIRAGLRTSSKLQRQLTELVEATAQEIANRN